MFHKKLANVPRIPVPHYSSDSEECMSPVGSVKRKCHFPSFSIAESSDEDQDSSDEQSEQGFGRDPNDLEPFQRIRASTITPGVAPNSQKLPTVFKWEGGGKNVYISGSFDHWKSKIPMVKSHGDFYTIIELEEGVHEYKFLVDGQWVCDPHEAKTKRAETGEEVSVFKSQASDSEKKVDNTLGTKNNVVTVKTSDFEVFEALACDSVSLGQEKSGVSGSPPGEYGTEMPRKSSGAGMHHSGPPILPPHLLQVILNKEIPVHCEPTLLPEPNHVMLNHLYALSIKDGVMVLSATHRYRKKYVTTLLYKPT